MALFGSSGARGSLEDGFGPDLVARIAQAAANHWDVERVAIGRDVRLTGPSFAAAATAGVTAAGCDVDRLGVAPTPAIQSYAFSTGYPAITITASHNPPEYNGVKLSDSSGGEISMDDYRAIERRIEEGSLETADWSNFGQVRYVDDVNSRYVEQVVEALNKASISGQSLTVAVDPGNGAGGQTASRVFQRLGCGVHTINADLDGTFPERAPEPLPNELSPLRTLVTSVEADLGIAHDGDADRAVFIDERGRFVEGATVLATLAEHAAAEGDVIVSAITASQRLVDAANRAGAELVLTRVGAANILTKVRELHAQGRSVAIAGEENGGIIFPRYRLTRDGAYIAGRMLELIGERSASEVFEPYTGYVTIRRDLPYGSGQERDRLLTRAETWANQQDGRLQTLDGFRVDLDDGWVLIRASGTEPLIRVYTEARDNDRALELVNDAVEFIRA